MNERHAKKEKPSGYKMTGGLKGSKGTKYSAVMKKGGKKK